MASIVALTLLAVGAGSQEPNRAHVRGRFLDHTGRPAHAEVSSRVWPGRDFIARTAADGSFEVVVEWPQDHPDTYYVSIVRAQGSARWDYDGKLAPGQELDLGTVTLEPGGTVSGKVLLGSKPQGDVWLIVVGAAHLPRVPSSHLEKCPAEYPGTVYDGPQPEFEDNIDQGSTADDGNFRIVGVPPGKYGIWARCEESWWAVTGAFEVHVAEETVIPGVVLEPLPVEHRVEGIVLGASGAPIAGAQVQAQSACRRIYTATSGPDGRFQFHVLPLSCGPLSVWATIEDGSFRATQAEQTEVGKKGLVLVFGLLRDLEIQVLDAGGAPVEHYGWNMVLADELKNLIGEPEGPRPGGITIVRFPREVLPELTIESKGFEDQIVSVKSEDRRLTVTMRLERK